jgi:uncharacterized protein YeaO (DUF488 family)
VSEKRTLKIPIVYLQEKETEKGGFMKIGLKRIYEEAAAGDGQRVLVDRIWPRGVSKEQAKVDVWMKDIAPSNELRKWFGHEPGRWAEFKQRYYKELEGKEEAVKELRRRAKKDRLTLLYAAKDEKHNNAVALREYLEEE